MSIPLTFDWSTLSWLAARFGCWHQQRCCSPRQLLLLLSLFVFGGCVPVTRFEETQSAAQVEMNGRRRAEHQLSQLAAENAELRAQLQRQGSAIDQRDQALAQAELDSSTQGKQREDAQGVVEQLRGELARAGGHLQSFHDEKQRLEASREVEAGRARGMARLARDAALALVEPIATGEYTLDAEQARIVLRVPRERVLADDGSVKAEAEPLLKGVARLLQLHPASKLRVEDSSAQADAIAVSRIVAALQQHAVAADRFEALAQDQAGAGTVLPGNAGVSQIVLGISVP